MLFRSVQTKQPIKLTNNSGLATQIQYGKGFVSGEIQFAELKIGEYTIPSQGAVALYIYHPVMSKVSRSLYQCQCGMTSDLISSVAVVLMVSVV